MRLTDLLNAINDTLQDTSNQKWGAGDKIRAANVQIHSIVREMTELDEAYFNVRYNVAKDAVTVTKQHGNIYSYTLPQWAMKIVSVRPQRTSDENEAPLINKVSRFDVELSGWRHWSNNQFMLQGESNPRDLTVEVAKRPAKLTKGTLPTQSNLTGSNQLRLDADTSTDAQTYPHETETDSYVGAIIEITGVNDATAGPGGQIRRCTDSAHLQLESGTRYTVLTMDRDWDVAPAASDTYEMHVEIGDEHLRYLQLRTARQLLQQVSEINALRALSGELDEERRAFTRHIQGRDIQQPKVMIPRLHRTYDKPRMYLGHRGLF